MCSSPGTAGVVVGEGAKVPAVGPELVQRGIVEGSGHFGRYFFIARAADFELPGLFLPRAELIAESTILDFQGLITPGHGNGFRPGKSPVEFGKAEVRKDIAFIRFRHGIADCFPGAGFEPSPLGSLVAALQFIIDVEVFGRGCQNDLRYIAGLVGGCLGLFPPRQGARWQSLGR